MKTTQKEYDEKIRKLNNVLYLDEILDQKIKSSLKNNNIQAPKGFFNQLIINGKTVFSKIEERFSDNLQKDDLIISNFLEKKLVVKKEGKSLNH